MAMSCKQANLPEAIRLLPGMAAFAMFTYSGRNDNDLSFEAGEDLDITGCLEKDPNWVIAYNSTGRFGQVPVNHIASAVTESLSQYPWYHGSVGRGDTELQLTPRSIDGLFLVRLSVNHPGDLTLSVVCKGQISHYQVRRHNLPGPKKRYYYTIDNNSGFYPLSQLIRHYAEDPDGLCCCLTKPASINVAPPPLPAPPPQPKLELQEVIGRGEFGEVHKGLYNGQEVAVKCLNNMTPATEAAAIQAFNDEARVMESLKHPNLVKFLGLIPHEGQLVLITEFMSLGSLLNYLRSRGQSVVTTADQLRFAVDVSSGMSYMASKRLVHRDLTARTVLLDQNSRAKVADFGLAISCSGSDTQLPSAAAAMATLTRSPKSAGTAVSGVNGAAGAPPASAGSAADRIPLKWTAPECIANRTRFSLKSDVWSFGVLMWEIFSYGRMPYPKIRADRVHNHVMNGFRMEMPDKCPPEVYKLMRACWEVEPSKRPDFARLHTKLRELQVGPSLALTVVR